METKSQTVRSGTIPFFVDSYNNLWVCLFISNNQHYGGLDPAIPKGRVDLNESPLEAAIRESHEETGIPKYDLTNIFQIANQEIAGMHDVYELYVFASRVKSMTDLLPTTEGIGKWYSISDAERYIRRSHRHFLDILKQKLNYKRE